ncbi:hypothetical protein ScPMuIL_001004 [Solemya velum]
MSKVKEVPNGMSKVKEVSSCMGKVKEVPSGMGRVRKYRMAWSGNYTTNAKTNGDVKQNGVTPEVTFVAEGVDPWAIVNYVHDEGPRWKELSCGTRLWRTVLVVIKLTLLVAMLYLFICSLGFLGDAFQLLGGKAAGKVFRESDMLQNPVAGLMIGVLATVLLQSSSTTTSIVITMTGASIMDIRQAIPMIMGANIGTSVTNTIVSLVQSKDRGEFRRAFGGATVHDMFNWLVVLVLLPLEVASDYLYLLTHAIISSMDLKQRGDKREFLKTITKPFTSLIVKVNKNVITDIAVGKDAEHERVLKQWCKTKTVAQNATVDMYQTFGLSQNLFAMFDISDHVAGIVLLLVSLILIVFSLIVIVKILNSLLKGAVARIIKKTINAEFPGVFAYFTGYVAVLIGAGMTMIVQSSSVFTSALTPLVGVGIVSIERMYPMTIGSNIGTTLTGILAALAAPASEIPHTLQVALCHLFFNISGLLLFFPIPFTRKAPIGLAKLLGNTTAKYRWFSVLYLIMMFFALPAFVFALSLAGGYVILGVGAPLLLLLIFVAIVNILQNKKPKLLPKMLQNWEFLPTCLHSLKPMDRVISLVTSPCQRCCCKPEIDVDTNAYHFNKAFVDDEKL